MTVKVMHNQNHSHNYSFPYYNAFNASGNWICIDFTKFPKKQFCASVFSKDAKQIENEFLFVFFSIMQNLQCVIVNSAYLKKVSFISDWIQKSATLVLILNLLLSRLV